MLEIIKIVVILGTILINVLLGATVLLRNPRSIINRLFLITSCGFSIWGICLLFYDYPIIFSSLFWIRATYIVASFIVICTLSFSFVFPRWIHKKALPYAILSSLVFLTFTIGLLFYTNLWVIDVVTTGEFGKQTILGPGYAYWVLTIWAVLIWALFNFISNKRKASGREGKQLEYLFLGFGLWGISVSVIDVILPLIWSDTRLFSIGITTSLFFTFSISYAIIKHRFLDIRLVVARSVAYSVLVLCLGGIYAGGLFIAGQYILDTNTSVGNLLVSTILALIIAISFQPLKKFLEGITEHIFYKEVYNAQDLLGSLSRIMASTVFLDLLVEKVAKELIHEMKMSYVFVALMKKSSIEWVKKEGNMHELGDIPKEMMSKLIVWAAEKSNESMVIAAELEESEVKKIMQQYNISIIVPFSVKSELIGGLLLGDKASGDIYSSKDIDVLKILVPEVSVAINNALSYEEIKNFNITLEKEVKSATSDLQVANERLKELDKVKDEFVSLASHELRTPMTAIKSYVWLLLEGKQGPLTEKQHEYLDRVYISTERLIQLVNDMLNVSRIESGRLTLNVQPINILQLTRDVIDEVLPTAQKQEINLSITPSEVSVPNVNCDPQKIKEVLINLIGNSMKFTPAKGSITVSYSVSEGFVTVKVEDTGSGIKKEDIQKLFHKFQMVGDTQRQNIHGTGLGLYICKSIVEAQGGKIWAESEGEGKGAKFYFTLPITSGSFNTLQTVV